MNKIQNSLIKKVAVALVIATFFACKATLISVDQNAYSIPMTQSMLQDSALLSYIAPYKDQMNADMQEVIGVSDVEMPRDRASNAPETLLGNFAVDLVLSYAQNLDSTVQFSLLNIGGLRNSLPKGEITKKNVYELMPFDNELVVLTLNGEQMEQMFLYLKDKPQPFGGLTVRYTDDSYQAFIQNKAFDKSKTYRVVTSDFLAEGGDLMYFFKTDQRENLNIKLRDVILQHVAKEYHITSKLDQRISYSHE